jgi:hypothetical protein
MSSSSRICELLTAALLFCCAGACGKKKEFPPPPKFPKMIVHGAATATHAPTITSTSGLDGTGQLESGGRGQRFRDAVVYLDGVPIAGMAYGELPSGLDAEWVTFESMYGEKPRRVRRFNLARYIKALGVDLEKLKAVHMIGGRERVTILEGSELRKFADKIQFSFTNSINGKPRFHWPPGIKINDSIDKANDVTLYVEKSPPLWTRHYTFELDGHELEPGEIAYVTTEIRGGTRIYKDGRLVTILKRNNLNPKNQLGVFPDGPRWSLKQELARLGVPLDHVRRADVVLFDETIARMSGKELEPLSFGVLGKSGGQIRLYPIDKGATVILLFEKSEPPDLKRR